MNSNEFQLTTPIIMLYALVIKQDGDLQFTVPFEEFVTKDRRKRDGLFN